MKKIALLMILSVGLFSCQQNKTAYVNNQDIMDGFEKLKQTEAEFTKEEQAIKAKIDSLVADSGYQELVQEYQSKKGQMPKAEEEELYNQIMQIQQRLGQQQQMTTQQFQQRKSAEMDSLMKTVDDFVEEFGKNKGYTYIYGVTESGNIMYADESLNITEEILEALNDKYNAEESVEDSEETDNENDTEN